MRPILGLVACSALGSACVLLNPLDGFSDGLATGADASTAPGDASGSSASSASSSSSGSTTSTASSGSSGTTVDAGPDTGGTTVVAMSDDFSNGSGACSLWTISGGTATIDPVGRTGPGSCRLCATNAASTPRLEKTLPGGPGAWTLEAWAKRVAGAPGKWKQELGTGANEGPVGPDWLELTTTFTSTSAAGVYVRIESDSTTAGDCFLVDDVVVTRKL